MELIHYLLILAVLVLAVGGFVFLQRRQESDTVAMPERPAAPTRRSGLAAALRNAWGGGLDDSTWDSFEEALLAADVGVAATTSII